MTPFTTYPKPQAHTADHVTDENDPRVGVFYNGRELHPGQYLVTDQATGQGAVYDAEEFEEQFDAGHGLSNLAARVDRLRDRVKALETAPKATAPAKAPAKPKTAAAKKTAPKKG